MVGKANLIGQLRACNLASRVAFWVVFRCPIPFKYPTQRQDKSPTRTVRYRYTRFHKYLVHRHGFYRFKYTFTVCLEYIVKGWVFNPFLLYCRIYHKGIFEAVKPAGGGLDIYGSECTQSLLTRIQVLSHFVPNFGAFRESKKNESALLFKIQYCALHIGHSRIGHPPMIVQQRNTNFFRTY